MEPFEISDDEIVALVLRRPAMWPTPLPTVDVDDAEEVVRAAVRGDRTLHLRGLLGMEGDAEVVSPQVLDVVDLAMSAALAWAMGYADDDLNWDPESYLMHGFADAAGAHRLLEETTPTGLHRVSRVPLASLEAHVLEVIRGTFETAARAMDIEESSSALLLTVSSPTGLDAFLVGAGSARRRTYSAAGQQDSTADVSLDDVLSAAIAAVRRDAGGQHGGGGDSLSATTPQA